MVDVIEVVLWDTFVGALSITENNLCTFEYSAEWKNKFGFSISPKFLPVNNRKFNFPELNPKT